MIGGLHEKTDLDIDKISQSTQSLPKSMMASMSFDKNDQSQLGYQTSHLSQVSVKDDARDLLEKYSKLLIEQVSAQLTQTMQKKWVNKFN